MTIRLACACSAAGVEQRVGHDACNGASDHMDCSESEPSSGAVCAFGHAAGGTDPLAMVPTATGERPPWCLPVLTIVPVMDMPCSPAMMPRVRQTCIYNPRSRVTKSVMLPYRAAHLQMGGACCACGWSHALHVDGPDCNTTTFRCVAAANPSEHPASLQSLLPTVMHETVRMCVPSF